MHKMHNTTIIGLAPDDFIRVRLSESATPNRHVVEVCTAQGSVECSIFLDITQVFELIDALNTTYYSRFSPDLG